MTAAQEPPILDLAVIGAGPAGMAAAAEAAELRLATVVLDEQPAPGGQVYRNVETAAPGPLGSALGESYGRGEELAQAFRAARPDYRPGATVWHIETGAGAACRVWFLREGRVGQVWARRVLLASGAVERPVPVPGWTLPGAMTVGALQTLLKSAGMAPAGPLVLIGNGPLLYLTATQIVAAGGSVSAVLLTGRPDAWRGALPQLPGFFASGALKTGLALLRAFRALGLRVERDVAEVEIKGDSRVETVRFRTGAGASGEIPAEVAALHEGVVPATNLARAIGCEHDWDEAQAAFRPRLDAWGRSTVEDVLVAGDGGGIAGAEAAPLAGRIAAIGAACDLGRIDEALRDRRAAPVRRELMRILRGRPFVDRLYAPRLAGTRLSDEVVICRCEEVTAGAVRGAVASGAQGPNQIKAFLRCGMGPCQGRFCASTVTRLIAEARGVPEAVVGTFRLRPPIKPVPLSAFVEAGEEA